MRNHNPFSFLKFSRITLHIYATADGQLGLRLMLPTPARSGYDWNQMSIAFIAYSGLNLRIKPKKRLAREKPEPLAVPAAFNAVCSMHFMRDLLSDGRCIQLFNVIDNFTAKAWASKLTSRCHLSAWSLCSSAPSISIYAWQKFLKAHRLEQSMSASVARFTTHRSKHGTISSIPSSCSTIRNDVMVTTSGFRR